MEQLGGIDIGKIMSSKGPIVKCVLLRATAPSNCEKKSANDDDGDATSPSSSLSSLSSSSRDISSMSIKEIKIELSSYEVDASLFVEKGELIKALEEARVVAKIDSKVVTQEEEEEDVDCRDDTTAKKEVPLQHLIEEIEVDTTPRKSMVSKILGGEFTFLGQYEEEGTMVMIRRPDWEFNADNDEDNSQDVPPINPHALQPPLHAVEVRGDILLMRVAETEEELDRDVEDAAAEGTKAKEEGKKEGENEEDEAESSSAKIHVPANDEFFLDFTREEYLKFAARTDIVAEEVESSSDEESEVDTEDAKPSATTNDEDENDDGNDDDEDDDFDPDAEDSDDEDYDSEEHQVGMMNMILGHMLRKFREENGRGPDSLELLEMRKALADRLGVKVPPVDEEACDWDNKSPSTKEKKHGKKVVVAEENNKTEEIPCREQSDEESDVEEIHIDGDAVAGLKRPAQDVIIGNGDSNGEQHNHGQGSNKRVRLDEDSVSGSSNDGKTEES